MKLLLLSFLAVLGLAVAASCSRDSPASTPTDPVDAPEVLATKKPDPKPKPGDDLLSVQDMLSDPLFQEMVNGIEEPSLAEPLVAAIDAFANGKTGMARTLFSRATAAAKALEDGPPSESLLYWSGLMRFFEEAGLQ